MLHSRITLSATAFYTAWLAEDLPEPHRALLAPVNPADVSDVEGSVLGARRRGWDELRSLGLAHGERVHEHLADTLHLLARSGVEYFGWFHHEDGGDTRSALVVPAGNENVVRAVVAAGRITLDTVRMPDPAAAFVALLPNVQPGQGGVVSLPAEEARGAATGAGPGPQQETGSFLMSASVARPSGNTVRLKQILGQPRTGGGQLYTARRDPLGRRQRCPHPLTYFDTPSGRYLTHQAPGPDGRLWVTVGPADARTLAARLHDLARSGN